MLRYSINIIWEETNERSSFLVNVSDEVPLTEGRGQHILDREETNEVKKDKFNN